MTEPKPTSSPATIPNAIEYEVSRLGQYVAVRIAGKLHAVVMPLKIAQARKLIREMQAVVDAISNSKTAKRKKRK
jgi:hypothetical protein